MLYLDRNPRFQREASIGSASEPRWVTAVLRFFPAPIFAFAGITACIIVFTGCLVLNWFEWSLLASAVCAFFASAASVIAVASIVRHVHHRRAGDHALPRYVDSQRKPTAAIVILLITVYSNLLCVGLHVFDTFFAANRAGNSKYFVTLGIAVTSTLYMAVHGRHVIRHHFGRTGDRNILLTPGQAVSVVLFLMALGAYFVWLLV